MQNTIEALHNGLGAEISAFGALRNGLGAKISALGALHNDLGVEISALGALHSGLGAEISALATLHNGLGAEISGPLAVEWCGSRGAIDRRGDGLGPTFGHRSQKSIILQGKQLVQSYEIRINYVEDVDRLFTSAIDAGATSTMPIQDQFDGDRRGTLTDPFGHIWLVATRKEDVSPDELQKRFESMLKQNNA